MALATNAANDGDDPFLDRLNSLPATTLERTIEVPISLNLPRDKNTTVSPDDPAAEQQGTELILPDDPLLHAARRQGYPFMISSCIGVVDEQKQEEGQEEESTAGGAELVQDRQQQAVMAIAEGGGGDADKLFSSSKPSVFSSPPSTTTTTTTKRVLPMRLLPSLPLPPPPPPVQQQLEPTEARRVTFYPRGWLLGGGDADRARNDILFGTSMPSHIADFGTTPAALLGGGVWDVFKPVVVRPHEYKMLGVVSALLAEEVYEDKRTMRRHMLYRVTRATKYGVPLVGGDDDCNYYQKIELMQPLQRYAELFNERPDLDPMLHIVAPLAGDATGAEATILATLVVIPRPRAVHICFRDIIGGTLPVERHIKHLPSLIAGSYATLRICYQGEGSGMKHPTLFGHLMECAYNPEVYSSSAPINSFQIKLKHGVDSPLEIWIAGSTESSLVRLFLTTVSSSSAVEEDDDDGGQQQTINYSGLASDVRRRTSSSPSIDGGVIEEVVEEIGHFDRTWHTTRTAAAAEDKTAMRAHFCISIRSNLERVKGAIMGAYIMERLSMIDRLLLAVDSLSSVADSLISVVDPLQLYYEMYILIRGTGTLGDAHQNGLADFMESLDYNVKFTCTQLVHYTHRLDHYSSVIKARNADLSQFDRSPVLCRVAKELCEFRKNTELDMAVSQKCPISLDTEMHVHLSDDGQDNASSSDDDDSSMHNVRITSILTV